MTLMVLLSRIPHPLEKGDKLRAFHFIKHLAKQHEIILCALHDSAPHPEAMQILLQYCKKVYFLKISKTAIFFNLINAVFNKKPFQVNYFYHKKAQKKINEIIATEKPDHIFCQIIRTTEYVKNINLPKTLDYQDSFSLGMFRRLTNCSFMLKPFVNAEYKRLASYEKAIFKSFNNKIIISDIDRANIPHPDNSQIYIIANGVDLEFFQPQENIKKTFDCIFTGNMGYAPNINATIFIANQLLPLLQPHYPNIKMAIAGANPHAMVKKTASNNIIVTGWVDDMRTYYAQSKIFIAPMFLGSGLQNKLLEAMAMKIPCITTPLANKALGAVDGESIIIAHDAQSFAKAIQKIMSDENFRNQLVENAYNFVSKNYRWDKNIEKLSQIIENRGD